MKYYNNSNLCRKDSQQYKTEMVTRFVGTLYNDWIIILHVLVGDKEVIEAMKQFGHLTDQAKYVYI